MGLKITSDTPMPEGESYETPTNKSKLNDVLEEKRLKDLFSDMRYAFLLAGRTANVAHEVYCYQHTATDDKKALFDLTSKVIEQNVMIKQIEEAVGAYLKWKKG